MSSRDLGLDRLRVLAAIAVVWLHVASLVVPVRPNATGVAWWTANFADAASRWAVPVFVMLTGAAGLDAAGAHGVGVYLRRRAGRILVPLVVWTGVYVGFRVVTEPGFGWDRAFETIRLGTPYYHLWYLYMLLGLTLVMPFLGLLARSASPRQLWALVALCFVIAAPEIVYRPARATFLPMFLPFVGYVLAGHLLRRAAPRVATGSLLRLAALGIYLTAVLTGLLLPWLGPKAWQVGYHYLNPLVVLTSLALFAAFRDPAVGAWLPERTVRRWVPATLGIYLVHPLWLWAIDRGIGPVWKAQPWWGIPAVCALVLVASAGSAMAMQRIPGLRRLV